MLSPHIKYFIEARRYKTIAAVIDYNKKSSFNKGQIQLFMNMLDLSYNHTYEILHKHKNLHTFDQDLLLKAFYTLKEFGFTKEQVVECPQVLTILPNSIEQHSLILQEAGFDKLTTACVKNYLTLMKKKVSLLKAHGLIPHDTNVQENLLSYLQPATLSSLEISEPKNDDVLHVIRQSILRKYLMWRLDMNNEEADHLFKTYPRAKNKSFRLMLRTLDILENELGFTKDRIKRNGYLVHGHPDNITNMLTQIKELGGIDIKVVVNRFPKILLTNYETVITTSHHLQNFDIPNAAIQRCYEIFTLGSKSVLERLLDLKSIPEFQVLSSHPRILRLVHYQKKARARLSYLQQLRVKCASLHILSSSRELFEKYAREGADKTKGKDIVTYLVKNLNLDENEIRVNLNRHPYWCHVPLVTVEATLILLKEHYFTNEEIWKNLHIVLYPKEYVKNQLQYLMASGIHPEMMHVKGATELNRCQMLALSLYFIEKKHHFTGDGVWEEQVQTEQTILVDAVSPLPPDSYSLTHHYKYGLSTPKEATK